jgi:hypothetical protein
MAFAVSARAVRCSRANAAALDVDVHVRHGPWTRAREFAPLTSCAQPALRAAATVSRP